MTANDLVGINTFGVGNGTNVDFGQGAAPVAFGFFTANSQSPNRTIGYDNFELVVTTEDMAPVPLPPGLPLVLVGLGCLAVLRRIG